MGWRIKLIDGIEWDAVSRRCRKFMSFRPGAKAAAKKAIHKRERRHARRRLDQEGGLHERG